MDPATRLLYARYGVRPVSIQQTASASTSSSSSSSSSSSAAAADNNSAASRNAPPPAEPKPTKEKGSSDKGGDKKADKKEKADNKKAAEPKAKAPAADAKPKVDKSKDPTALRMAEEGRKRAELMKNMTADEKKAFRKKQEEADKKAAADAAAAAAAAKAPAKPAAATDKKTAAAPGASAASTATAAAEGGDGEESIEGDVTVKVPKGTRDIKPEQMMIREQAFALIKGVFQRHGAVQIDTPVFELKETLTNKYGEDGGKLIYELADQGGELLALRYDLTVPFARYLATYKVGNIKRFHIGRVYRRDQPIMTRGRFREFYQCDFDIAGYESAPPMLPDAECLKVLSEILDALPIGQYTIKLNHRKVLDAIMAVAGVPADKFRPVCSAIDKLDKEEWKAVEEEIIDKLDPEAAKAGRKPAPAAVKTAKTIGQLVVDQAGEPFALLAKLQKNATLASNASAAAGFKELTAMCEFMKMFGMLNRITLDMSLARGLDYYTGVIYEAVLLQSAPATDSKSATATATGGSAGTAAVAAPPVNLGSIAAGGRYDGLVGMFSGKAVPAVGVSVGIERIFNLLEEAERKKGAIRKSHTQVLLCSAGKDMLPYKLAMATELWSAGIAAEFEYHAAPSPKDQGARADREMIPITVWVGADELKKGVVTVKDMRGQHTFDEAQRGKNHGTAIKRDQLVAHIKNLLNR